MTTSVMSKLLKAARVESLLLRVDVFEPPKNWRARSACRGLPFEWFYGPNNAAAPVCSGCDVQLACLVDTIRIEGRGNVEEVAGYRCVTADARRRYITRQRAEVAA